MTVDEPLGRVLDALVRFETRLAALAAPVARLLDDDRQRVPWSRRWRRGPVLTYAAGDMGSIGSEPNLAA